MTFSDAEIRMSTISLSRLKKQEKIRERENYGEPGKSTKQNFCLRNTGNDYFHHDGNEFSVPLYSPG